MPSLCSIDTQRTSLARPVGQDLRHQEQRIPRVPCGASGGRARTRWTILSARSCSPKVMKILVPDPQLPSPAGSARVFERADVGARLRLGQVHRPGPFAGDQLGQLAPAARPCREPQRLDRAGVSIITARSPYWPSPDPPSRRRERQRQALPAMVLGPGQRAPAALDIGAIGLA